MSFSSIYGTKGSESEQIEHDEYVEEKPRARRKFFGCFGCCACQCKNASKKKLPPVEEEQ
jgi:hypothetical protein